MSGLLFESTPNLPNIVSLLLIKLNICQQYNTNGGLVCAVTIPKIMDEDNEPVNLYINSIKNNIGYNLRCIVSSVSSFWYIFSSIWCKVKIF